MDVFICLNYLGRFISINQPITCLQICMHAWDLHCTYQSYSRKQSSHLYIVQVYIHICADNIYWTMNTAALSGFSELDDGDFIDQSDYNYKTLDFSSQLSKQSFQCIMKYYISFHHIPINFPFLIQLNLQCNSFSGSPHCGFPNKYHYFLKFMT